MKLAITGHRPDKLPDDGNRVIASIGLMISGLGADYLYIGMAPGADLWAAYAGNQLGIPYEAVLPYKGHREMMRTDYWTNVWDQAYKHADRVEVLSDAETYPGHWCMHNRNHYMVDHADEVFAVWNGDQSGGTYATVEYAKKKGKKITVWNPDTNETYLCQ